MAQDKENIYGFDADDLGKLVKFIPDKHEQNGGHYVLADTMTNLTTRTNLPDGLVRYLQKQARDQYQLTHNDLAELSNAKLIDFWLLQLVDDADQKACLLELFDTKSGVLRRFQEKVDAQNKALYAGQFSADDKATLADTHEKVVATMSAMEKLYKAQRKMAKQSQADDAATFRAVVWLVARQMGWAAPSLPAPGNLEQLQGALSSDNYLKMCTAMRDVGEQEVKRMNKMKMQHRV